MPRVKRGRVRAQKRKSFLSETKGYKYGRKNLIRAAKTAIKKAGVYAYRDRRNKKRLKRRIWSININAAVRKYDLSYSKFIDLLKKANIDLDRKVLADMAENKPKVFEAIVKSLKS